MTQEVNATDQLNVTNEANTEFTGIYDTDRICHMGENHVAATVFIDISPQDITAACCPRQFFSPIQHNTMPFFKNIKASTASQKTANNTVFVKH